MKKLFLVALLATVASYAGSLKYKGGLSSSTSTSSTSWFGRKPTVKTTKTQEATVNGKKVKILEEGTPTVVSGKKTMIKGKLVKEQDKVLVKGREIDLTTGRFKK